MKLMRMTSALMAVMLLLCGCRRTSGDGKPTDGDNQNSTEEQLAWQKYADTPVTFDWYINYSWYSTPWGGNLVSDTITEETGVSINFITPMGNEAEKLQSLIASDSLPDIITLGWWEPEISDMIKQDKVYALNELADKYDMYFYQVTDPQIVSWYTQSDGNIYAYPNSSISPKELESHDNIGSNQTFLVRKDIYEAIGSPDMSTVEGFEAAVRKAVEMFPDVDGEPLIPIGAHEFTNEGNSSFDQYLMNFLAIPFEKNGIIYDRHTDPEYLKWLKAFRQLASEGYLSDDIFVDSRTQMEEKIADGRYFCMIYQYTDMLAQQKELNAKEPDKIYIAVEGPHNSNGDDPTLPVTSINGWTVTLISKNCKEPDRAIAFIDYMMSERGQKIVYLGVEGETYDMVDGVPVMKEEAKELLNSDRTAYDKKYGADNAYWMFQNIVMQLQWEQKAIPAIQQLKEWGYKYAMSNSQYDAVLPADSQGAKIDAAIKALWEKTLVNLLLSENDNEFDQILSDFVQEREELGYAELIKESTEQMNKVKEKLGIE